MGTRGHHQLLRGLALAGLLPALAPVAGAASIRPQSWYDAEHGWVVVNGSIRSTDDGGRSWRRVGPGGGGEVIGVVRTGLRAGLYYTLAHGPPRAYWTADGGRRWRLTSAIGGGAVGSGRLLFWTKGGHLYRVTPWPPTTPTVRSKLVLSLPAGTFAGEAIVPGGIVAASAGIASPHALVVRWLGKKAPTIVDRELPQPQSGPLQPCSAYLEEALVNWPAIVIPACPGTAGPVAVWRSTSGGASWSLVGPG